MKISDLVIYLPESGGDAAHSALCMLRDTNAKIVLADSDEKALNRVYNYAVSLAGHQRIRIDKVLMPKVYDERYVGNLKKVIQEKNINCVVASAEYETPEIIEVIRDTQVINMLSDKNIYLKCKDKYEFAKENEEISVPTELEFRHGYNLCKPRFGAGSRGILIVSGQPKNVDLESKLIYQRLCKEPEYVMDIVYNQGISLGHRIRHVTLMKAGMDIEGNFIPNHTPEYKLMINSAEKLSSRYKFNGPINIQFMELDGKLKIIEVNTRLSGASRLCMKTGFNPLKLYFSTIGLGNETYKPLMSSWSFVRHLEEKA